MSSTSTVHATPSVRQQVPVEDDGERPFTNMIDKLIQEERNKTERINSQHTQKTNHNNIDLDVQQQQANPPHPQVNAQLATTSNHTSSQTDFQPLIPETDSEAAFSGVGERIEPMSDEQFVRYYKDLSPFERKRQIQMQKAALLEEQTYLKSLLVQQEKLLQAKQEQLNMQHELQQERLRYFERTGNFPPHDPRIKLPFLEKEPYPLQGNQQQEPQPPHPSQQHTEHPDQMPRMPSVPQRVSQDPSLNATIHEHRQNTNTDHRHNHGTAAQSGPATLPNSQNGQMGTGLASDPALLRSGSFERFHPDEGAGTHSRNEEIMTPRRGMPKPTFYPPKGK